MSVTITVPTIRKLEIPTSFSELEKRPREGKDALTRYSFPTICVEAELSGIPEEQFNEAIVYQAREAQAAGVSSEILEVLGAEAIVSITLIGQASISIAPKALRAWNGIPVYIAVSGF